MAVVVQKYGGSSVADVERIRRVAERIAATRRSGKSVCVVVSAMGKTTDELLSLAKKVSPAPLRRELDMLLTAGERISMALLSMALNDLGVEAISFTGSQSGIITNDSHASARIVEVRPTRVQEELGKGKVVIVAGFQGVSPRKEVTTLGRGGSDTTAVALAAALSADCEIYSDVDGVYTADPRVVERPRRLDSISYEEMQELAQAGAKVLNAQAVEFAREKGIAIHARATQGSTAETVVAGSAGGAERIAGVTSRKGVALLTIPTAELPEALELMERSGALASESWQHGAGATLALPLDDVHDWPAVRAALERAIGAVGVEDEGLGSVSVVGTGFTAGYRVPREVRRALEELRSPPRAMATTALRVTAWCGEAALPGAVRLLHARLIEGAA